MKRSTVVIALAMAPIALSVCIGVAFGTPGSNAVSVYPARGSVGSATEPLVLGTPKAVTVTRTVRVKTKSRLHGGQAGCTPAGLDGYAAFVGHKHVLVRDPRAGEIHADDLPRGDF